MLKKDVQQGRRRSKNRRRTLLGYVEDSCEMRTKLAGFLSILPARSTPGAQATTDERLAQ
jgi:hypothetical protein